MSSKAGIYIHIPFCKKKCIYCDFYSFLPPNEAPGRILSVGSDGFFSKNYTDEFIAALKKETELRKDVFSSFDSIYLGGGTPSMISEKNLESLFCTIFESFAGKLEQDTEITLEANPGDITRENLNTWRSIGVNRLSIGIQSMDDDILRFLGRRHDAESGLNALNLAMEGSFNHVSCDLLMGLPIIAGKCLPSLSTMEASIDRVLLSGATHISLYILTLSGSTPLARLVDREKVVLPSDDLNADRFLKTSAFLAGRGFIHYEVSNFASNKKAESRHNKKYWTGSPYLGLGPGAHSFDGLKTRWWNLPEADTYINNLTQGSLPPGKKEILTKVQRRIEKLMLGLRTSRGVSKKLASPQGNHDLVLKEMIRTGLLTESTTRVFPTEKGMLKADGIASALS